MLSTTLNVQNARETILLALLCIGVTTVPFGVSGNMPVSRGFRNSILNGLESHLLHVLDNMVGRPSGPDAEFESRSLIAASVSSIVLFISRRDSGIEIWRSKYSFGLCSILLDLS